MHHLMQLSSVPMQYLWVMVVRRELVAVTQALALMEVIRVLVIYWHMAAAAVGPERALTSEKMAVRAAVVAGRVGWVVPPQMDKGMQGELEV